MVNFEDDLVYLQLEHIFVTTPEIHLYQECGLVYIASIGGQCIFFSIPT